MGRSDYTAVKKISSLKVTLLGYTFWDPVLIWPMYFSCLFHILPDHKFFFSSLFSALDFLAMVA